MDGLLDYTKEKKFWQLVESQAAEAKETFTQYWDASETAVLNKEEACECLNALFIDSHARILTSLGKVSKSIYPTTKRSPNRLLKREELWWVDHFTAGISHVSTLNWFGSSSEGKASTHFVVGYHSHPFYIVPLMHGAWHAPARNADSWSIEMVNAGPIKNDKDKWLMWNGRILPEKLVKELPPQPVSPAYKGANFFQPFTTDQVKTNIKLKRIIRWATEDKLLSRSRMSQHSQWQTGKSDMGPLWPFDDVNDAAFTDYPLDEIASFHLAMESVELPSNVNLCTAMFDDIDTCPENPEYGLVAEPGKESSSTALPTTKELQQLLVDRGYSIHVDGIYGIETKEAVTRFQRTWNDNNPADRLVVDGVVGPQTLTKLKR